MSTGTTERPVPTEARNGTFRIVVVIAIALAVAVAGFSLMTRSGEAEPAAAPPLVLSLGVGDGLASCLPFEVPTLATMPVAFAATAESVEGEMVTLSVDRWYAGGDSATVTLSAPAGMEALIGGIAFTAGEQYLITATDGVVNYCGYSAPATAEMRAAFDQAFPG
jgi:hypothetical protein